MAAHDHRRDPIRDTVRIPPDRPRGGAGDNIRRCYEVLDFDCGDVRYLRSALLRIGGDVIRGIVMVERSVRGGRVPRIGGWHRRDKRLIFPKLSEDFYADTSMVFDYQNMHDHHNDRDDCVYHRRDIPDLGNSVDLLFLNEATYGN